MGFRTAMATAMVMVAAPTLLQAQTGNGTGERAAVLVYRQALHPDGDALGLAARLLTERAGAEVEADALTGLRERVLEASEGVKRSAPAVPGAVPDQMAALVARHVEAQTVGGAPRLLPAWRQVERREDFHGLLPYLLAEAAAGAGRIWYAALTAADDDEALAEALAPVVAELAGTDPGAALGDWLAVEPALNRERLSLGTPWAWRENARSALASALDEPADISPVITARLRAQWFLAGRDDTADPVGLALSGLSVGLRANAGGLASGDPLPFLVALNLGAQRLAVAGDSLSSAHRRELEATVDILEGLPPGMLEGWSDVDRRLPAIFQSVLEVLSEAAADEDGKPPSPSRLLMAGARVTVLDDDWEAYSMQPFREPIQQALDQCLPLEAASAAECRARFRDWGLEGAAIPEASGDVGGPFQTENLLRELSMNPWQRVNYLRGFWRDLLARECTDRARIGNAMEWALAARAFVATLPEEREPGDGDIRDDLDRLADAGMSLAEDLQDFGACQVQGRGPIRQVLAAYLETAGRLAEVMERAGQAYRDRQFAEGADIELDAGPGQATRYAPENMSVGPCDETPSCGVALQLPVSEALYRRFPAPYRVADQSGMGSLSICYSDVSWVERRAEPVASSGGIMANFHGRLGFRLRGRFQTGGEARDVFVLRMVTDEVHNYLFAPDRPAVLADPCPRQFQGQMATGELPEARGWLVPRRLTYLSGQRSSPAQLFAENWSRPGGWRERLAKDEAAVERAADGEDVADRVEDHLARLRDRQRDHLYERLLAPMVGEEDARADRELTATTRELAALRQALGASVRVLTPGTVMLDPMRRAVLYGSESLVGLAEIRAWRDQGRDPMALPDLARARAERAIDTWRLPSGRAELPPFVAHALIDLLAVRQPPGAG